MEDLNSSQVPESAPIPVHGQSGIFTPLLTVLCPLLVVIFIFLFWKFCCRRQIMVLPGETSNYTGNSTMRKSRHDSIGAMEIQSISVELFEGDFELDAQCSICLGDLVDGNNVKLLPKCSHAFHPECIDMWLSSSSSSPLCRASLVSRPLVDPCMVV